MIHLQFTHQDTEHLQLCLNRLQTLSPDDAADARYLLGKLHQAQLDAIPDCHCPICNTAFSQHAIGRTGRYCSNACTQKAYRQRILERKRQFGPTRRT